MTSGRSPPSHAAEKIANSEDLITQILIHLPIKPLIRFKSVSNHWLSLISDPQFSQLRRNIFSGHISGLFLPIPSRCFHYVAEFDFVNLDLLVSNPTKPPFKTLNFADDRSRIRIVQSCNGLLRCCSDRSLQTRESFVYNPTTKQLVKLPPVSNTIFGLSLAFDPSKSSSYKVVCVRSCEVTEDRYQIDVCSPEDQYRIDVYSPEDQYQIDVYSPEDRHWKLCGGSFHVERNLDVQFDGGVFWNGSVHWISDQKESVYFNVDEERIGLFPMPPVVENWEYNRSYRYFGESRGHLHSIENTYDLQMPRFDVYELESDYSLWTLKFRVDLSQAPSSFPEIVLNRTSFPRSFRDYVFSVLCVVRGEFDNDDDEDSYLVLQIPGKVLRYDLRAKTLFKLCYVELRNRTVNAEALPCGNSVTVISPDLAEWPHVYQFIESQALV